ncbi:MAG: PIN domain-containing protein [Candidatus Methanoperedens sp.]|nr:PIN domain-containing protein [Candidatus Methanoperedens sp.]
MNDELSLIDTNLLSYVFDESEPEKKIICKDLTAECWKGKQKYAVSVQNLSEFYVVVTKKIQHPIPEKVAKRFIELILDFQGWHVLSISASTIASAIDISNKYKIHYWDALLAATMRENKVFSIYTEDSDFGKIPWLKAINPFELKK